VAKVWKLSKLMEKCVVVADAGYGSRPLGLDACLGMGLGGAALARLAHIGCLLYLVALLPLPLFFRFVVLVTVHLYDSL
jgi:hypothetical protein